MNIYVDRINHFNEGKPRKDGSDAKQKHFTILVVKEFIFLKVTSLAVPERSGKHMVAFYFVV